MSPSPPHPPEAVPKAGPKGTEPVLETGQERTEPVLEAGPKRTEAVLKAGPKRTVVRTARGTVVKRFHAPGLLDRWKDPLRAWREARMLRQLARRGVRVPRAVAWRRTAGGGWELELEEVPGAVDLAALLESSRRPSLAQLRGLLTLAVDMVRAGHRHADLHPGNVLLDGQDRAWLIDVGRGRAGGALSTRELTDLLATAGGRLRERLDARARGWLAGRLLREWGAPHADPAALEAEARRRRAREASRRDDRWLRASGSCVQRGTGFAHRRPAAGPWSSSAALQPAEARTWWVTLGRLEEHRLPAARAVLLREAAGAARLVHALPEGAVTLQLASDAVEGRGALAGPLGSLLGQLHDRALEWDPSHPVTLARTPSGELLVVRAALRAAPLGQSTAGGACLRAALAWLSEGPGDGRASEGQQEAFARAYADGHQGGPADRLRALARCREALA